MDSELLGSCNSLLELISMGTLFNGKILLVILVSFVAPLKFPLFIVGNIWFLLFAWISLSTFMRFYYKNDLNGLGKLCFVGIDAHHFRIWKSKCGITMTRNYDFILFRKWYTIRLNICAHFCSHIIRCKMLIIHVVLHVKHSGYVF